MTEYGSNTLYKLQNVYEYVIGEGQKSGVFLDALIREMGEDKKMPLAAISVTTKGGKKRNVIRVVIL